MGKACPSCGAAAMSEARFCRLCGTPLRLAGTSEAPVSPMAQTIPLVADESRPTDGLAANEAPRSSSETSKINRDEMERLLRRPHIEPSAVKEIGPLDTNGHSSLQTDYHTEDIHTTPIDSADLAVPDTNELEPEQQATGTTPIPAKAGPRRTWLFVAGVLLCALGLVALLTVFISRRHETSDQQNPAPVVSETEQPNLVEAQLSQAETLLNAGDVNGAISHLRDAVKHDPNNARAHKLLGEALLRAGSRHEAIDEYLAATRLDSNDAAAWHALASAQFAEQQYADAVESYHKLISLTGEDALDDGARLEYADALRLAGYTEDARRIYQKVAATAPADLAHAAEKHLSELPPSRPAANTRTDPLHETRAEAQNGTATTTAPAVQPEAQFNRHAETTAPPTASPSTAPTPAPPQQPPAKQSVAQTDPDTYYSQALSIISGRDLKTLPQAELLHALELFQRAASGGTHRAQASKYVERLGREYDRRRNPR